MGIILWKIIEVKIVTDEIRRIDGNDENPVLEECMESAGQDELAPLERWIQKSPQSRFQEIEYIENSGFQHQLQVTDAGDIQQVLMIDKWMFLMVIDKTFPKETENFEKSLRGISLQGIITQNNYINLIVDDEKCRNLSKD